MRTRVTDLLGIRHPVLLGGMAGASGARLVAAVSQAGGLGLLAGSTLAPAALEAEIAGIRELTSLPFGVNLLLWSASYKVETVLAQQPAVLSTAWGNPSPYIEVAHEAGALVVHMVHDVPGAIAASMAGVDLIVAQGHEGGGHVGLQSTFTLLPQVVDAVGDIPVVAAGGIADGRGLAAALALGAEGVLMGTRFLATVEAPIPDGWKRSILEAGGHQTVYSPVIDIANEAAWPSPAAARAIRNAFLDRWVGKEDEVRERSSQLGRELAAAKRSDDRDEMAMLAGEAVGLINDLPTAAEVVERIVREAEALLPQLAAKLAGKRVPNARS
ncbi:MAG: nitronate monooxygenase [Candidatus Dormibacteraeota bacterium]|nr:nitronate monooxygenase [Candidatus Dormibacteraeota bacterium]